MSHPSVWLRGVLFSRLLTGPIFAGLAAGGGQREGWGTAWFWAGHEATVDLALGTAAEDTLVGQMGWEQLVSTEDLSVLVRGPIMLAGPWWGPEPRRGMRFHTAGTALLRLSHGLGAVDGRAVEAVTAHVGILGASAAEAVHQTLRLQVGVPALTGGVSLPMEKAEHVWAGSCVGVQGEPEQRESQQGGEDPYLGNHPSSPGPGPQALSREGTWGKVR